jgi:uncharacterized protein YjbI with pentapeptide repeats
MDPEGETMMEPDATPRRAPDEDERRLLTDAPAMAARLALGPLVLEGFAWTADAFGALQCNGVTFRNVSVYDAQLRGCRFEGCRFEGVELAGGTLADLSFERCEFVDVTITRCAFDGVSVKNSRAERATLRGVDARASAWSDCELTACVVAGGASSDGGYERLHCDGLDVADLRARRPRITEVSLRCGVADHVSLSGGDLRGLRAHGTRWSRLEVLGVEVRGVEVDAVDRFQVRFGDARIEDVVLRAAGEATVAFVRCETAGLSVSGASGATMLLVEDGSMAHSEIADGAAMVLRWLGARVGPAVRVRDMGVAALDLERSEVTGLSLARVMVSDVLDLTGARLAGLLLDGVEVSASAERYDEGAIWGEGAAHAPREEP